jgi:hypothetical protein
MSSSALPYKRTPPSWCKTTGPEVGDSVSEAASGVSEAAIKQHSSRALQHCH